MKRHARILSSLRIAEQRTHCECACYPLPAAHLEHAWNDGRPEPYAAFENVGRAYLAFARDEPAYYSAMFETGLSLDDDPDLREVAEHSFAVLRRASETLCARLPANRRPPALMMSLHIWALSHGVASLFARGDSGRRRLPMSAEELLEAGVLVYLRGLGLFAPPEEPER